MVTRLREGIWWLDLGGVNAYLVDDGGAVTLIDAGPPWRAGAILDGLFDAGFALTDLDRVLVTHYDADHVAGLSRLAGLDVEVYAGRGDAGLVAGSESPDFGTRKGFTQALMAPLVRASPVEVQSLDDGDTVGSFTVYETPGHTPGHVAYVSEDLDAAFVGDLLRESGGRVAASPWFISDDIDAVHESVRSLSAQAPDFSVLGMGHGVPFERGGKDRLDDLSARV
jgi:glyoxylase-like metal-dependent hydrolase (beta-lactamase superfamily II)